jgi:hypothetical protein
MKKFVVVIGLASLVGACGGGDDTPDGLASIDVTWGFTPTNACQAGESIHFALTPDPFGDDDIFDCLNGEHDPADQSGTIGAIPLGSYTIDASVYLNDQAELDVAPDSFSVSLDVDGQNLTRTVTFARGAQAFDVTFTVDFGNAGGMDCDQTTAGGTGVNQQTVDLVDLADSTCVAVVIAEDDAQYDHADACSTDPSVCMGAGTGDSLTLLDVPPGNYRLDVTGINFMGDTCWEGSATFGTATATSDTLDIGAVSVPHNGASGGCSLKPSRPGSLASK